MEGEEVAQLQAELVDEFMDDWSCDHPTGLSEREVAFASGLCMVFARRLYDLGARAKPKETKTDDEEG